MRIDVRPSLEAMQLSAANGVFEIKEHLAAIGLGLLPAYSFSEGAARGRYEVTTARSRGS